MTLPYSFGSATTYDKLFFTQLQADLVLLQESSTLSAIVAALPSTAKAWCKANISGAAVVSFNVSSVIDVAIGAVTINWTVPFATANYCPVASCETNAFQGYSRIHLTTAGSIQIKSADSTGTETDPVAYYCVAFGAQ